MDQRLYGELVPWYRLLDPPEEHEEEARAFTQAIQQAAEGPVSTLLELGSGAGHNALHMKTTFRCTLVDVSEPMLALSRELNPDCEHLTGDMRSVRLERTFDAVLIHDAITYMTSEADLRAAAETAFVHTRSGGVALFAPDCVRETFRESCDLHEGDGDRRSMRCLEWSWDPDPSDDTYTVEYAFLLRDGVNMTAAHDRHVEGLFTRAAWDRILASVGYRVGSMRRPIGNGQTDEVFLCRKP